MKSKTTSVCCKDCYFHRADLCALQVAEACPTFRPYTSHAFVQHEPVRLPHKLLADVDRGQLKVAAA